MSNINILMAAETTPRSEQSKRDGGGSNDAWMTLDRGTRSLRSNRTPNSLNANLTDTPAKVWDWSDADMVVVTVEENHETGRRRVTISQDL